MHKFTVVLACLFISHFSAAQDIPKVIYDTDMTGDCDDCGALAVLHALADRGEVEILGCVATFGKAPYVAGCIDAINTYYGRGDLPIGAMRDDFGRPASHYLEPIATDTERYGHDVVKNSDVPDHVTVYRELLTAQPDGSATIVTVGRLKGIHDLLVSKPDDISKLDGVALVNQKVKEWVCMGGRYPNEERGKEANFAASGGADYTANAIGLCPVPIIFTGFEIGFDVLTGPAIVKQPDDNPVARAYRLWFGALPDDKKTDLRPSWDQTAVVIAVHGTAPWWNAVDTGHNEAGTEGVNIWRATPDKDHMYITVNRPPKEVAEYISELMNQKPRD